MIPTSLSIYSHIQVTTKTMQCKKNHRNQTHQNPIKKPEQNN